MSLEASAGVDIPLYRPTHLADAIALLQEHEDARPLGGGQTLVSMLSLGYAQPSAIVALGNLPELRGISRSDDGSVRIGAMTTHAELAACRSFAGGQALLTSAASQIADPAIRNFGTIGGACAHGDSVADWPPALVAADARMLVHGPDGAREIKACDFFVNLLTTALKPAELLIAIVIPAIEGHGRYRKLARVEGDFATVSVAATAASAGGACTSVAIAIGACGPRPVRLAQAEALLIGRPFNEGLAIEVGQLLADAIDPISDVRGSAAYRKRVLPRLVAQSIQELLA
ncbi:xanthine dehydrogenase family protein subunit M [Variovorax sp. M-6]|uniref:FAD binding domain-containing protein n=1 Tax=Variovorax sp. M-6 TaxID=3233041 RepID=UPI003F9A5326